MLIQNCMQKYQGSPASSLDKQLKQSGKGTQQIAHNMVLMQEEIDCLQDAIEASTKRKSRKRWHVQTEEMLTVGKVSDLLAAKDGSSCKEDKKPAKRVHAERCCGRCGKIVHNSCTGKVEIEEVEDSNASE
jgi:hypothetical protein